MSIKKIAEEAGVSISTVSRVLNNPDYKCQSEELRNKIWNIAIKMNYTPNLAARNLKLGKSPAEQKTYYINVLMTRTDASQTDPFFTELLNVVESEIHKNACILSHIWYMPVFSNDAECERGDIRRTIDRMYGEVKDHADGLVVIGKCNSKALKYWGKKYDSIVSVNRNSTNYEVDEVLCDGEKIAKTAVEYLVKLGHRNIGYVGGCRNEARYRGFLKVLEKNDIEVVPGYIMETKQTEAEGYETMKKFITMENPPTGIYCANDITAIGMLKCLNKYRNIRYSPSIISSDDIEEAQFTQPMLTTVRLPRDEMGKFAIGLLTDRMKGGHKSVSRVELEGRLVVRSSCSKVDDIGWCDYCI